MEDIVFFSPQSEKNIEDFTLVIHQKEMATNRLVIDSVHLCCYSV